MMVKPCPECPFADPNQLYLNYERKVEIVAAIRADSPFYCHNTVDYGEDVGQVTSKTKMCAGSVILEEREGILNQYGRIMERVGLYDRDKLDIDNMELVPYPTFDDWIEATA